MFGIYCALGLAALDRGQCVRPEGSMSMRLGRDGHFILEEQLMDEDSVIKRTPRTSVTTRKMRQEALDPDPAVASRPVIAASYLEDGFSASLAKQYTQDFARAEACLNSLEVLPLLPQLPAPGPSSLAEATTNSEAAVSTALIVRQPNKTAEIPPEPIAEKPSNWKPGAWKFYNKVKKIAFSLRGGVVNVGATFAAMGLGPDNCILKLIYIMYTHQGEDDYPYLPQGCGDGFNFLVGGARHSAGLSVLALISFVVTMALSDF